MIPEGGQDREKQHVRGSGGEKATWRRGGEPYPVIVHAEGPLALRGTFLRSGGGFHRTRSSGVDHLQRDEHGEQTCVRESVSASDVFSHHLSLIVSMISERPYVSRLTVVVVAAATQISPRQESRLRRLIFLSVLRVEASERC